jgi:hypothetical protein
MMGASCGLTFPPSCPLGHNLSGKLYVHLNTMGICGEPIDERNNKTRSTNGSIMLEILFESTRTYAGNG